ncbi:tail fiber domain-containing protein [Maricaulis sp.]|uniref:tail fiber domain-containing protein n=1 Tax=Maricaulis sp. TaxID=1486257 RepID=UPI002633BE0D|nr:tail fiber domain-containing protein [Maricaulis sp.]MDF1769830.1 tail fiber domain-containing protein [Maricaulis sp.]
MSLGGGSSTTTTSVDVPAWYQQAQQNNINTATQIANRPYQAYGGPRIADWTQDQQAAFGQVRDQVGQSGQAYDEAAGYIRQGADPIQAQGYDPAQMSGPNLGPAQGYNAVGPAGVTNVNAPNLGQAQGYDAPTVGGGNGYAPAGAASVSQIQAPELGPSQGYDASMFQASNAQGVTGAQQMGSYIDPWTNQVIDRAMGDLDRMETRDLSEARRRAAGAQAFGGSRSAIMESEIGRRYDDQAADMVANLRSQGFNTALQAGQADAGRMTDVSQFNAGQNQQASESNANRMTDAARYAADMGNSFSLQQAGMDMEAAGLNSNALNTAALDAAGRSDVAGQFGAQARNDQEITQAGYDGEAARYAADMGNQFTMRGADMSMDASMANAGARNAAQMDYAGRRDVAGQYGADAQNNFALQQAGFDADASGRNMDAVNMANQFGANLGFDAQMANRANAMAAGQNLTGLEGQRRGATIQDTQRLFDIGELERGMRQQGLDTAFGDFNRQQNYDWQGLQQMIAATSGVPTSMFGQTSTGPSNGGGMSGIGSALSGIAAVGGLFSDRRLKQDIVDLGGGLYEFAYKWDPATRIVGVMADEVPERYRIRGMSGFDMVDYGLMMMEAA